MGHMIPATFIKYHSYISMSQVISHRNDILKMYDITELNLEQKYKITFLCTVYDKMLRILKGFIVIFNNYIFDANNLDNFLIIFERN